MNFLAHTRPGSQTINFAGLIGRDVDTGQLLARMPYAAYTDKGEPIPGGSGMLSKEGLTSPIFTPQAEKITVVLGGDGKWLKFGDVVHDARGEGDGVRLTPFGVSSSGAEDT